jgi:beta-xylosidase
MTIFTRAALVETQTGEWWTVLFYDKGAYGRLPNLQPVTWVDNWPEIGVEGKGVTTYQKPDVVGISCKNAAHQ